MFIIDSKLSDYAKKIYDKFGWNYQSLVLIEEFSECIKTIIKIHRYGFNTVNPKTGKTFEVEFIEEMGDVFIAWNTIFKGQKIDIRILNYFIKAKRLRDNSRFELGYNQNYINNELNLIKETLINCKLAEFNDNGEIIRINH